MVPVIKIKEMIEITMVRMNISRTILSFIIIIIASKGEGPIFAFVRATSEGVRQFVMTSMKDKLGSTSNGQENKIEKVFYLQVGFNEIDKEIKETNKGSETFSQQLLKHSCNFAFNGTSR